MPTFLYIHPLRTDTEQRRYRSSYEIKQMDFELSRDINARGEIISDVTGGRISVVLDGFGDEELFRWLFGPGTMETGEFVIIDDGKQTTGKLLFSRAVASGYRLHFDANLRNAVTAVLTIEAGEIMIGNELLYEKK